MNALEQFFADKKDTPTPSYEQDQVPIYKLKIDEEDLLAINFDSIQLLYKFVEHLKMKNDEC